MGLKKRKKKKKTQHKTTPIYTIAEIITFHYCVCEREREREREREGERERQVDVVLHLLRRIYPVQFSFFICNRPRKK